MLDPQTHARAIALESPDVRCREEKEPKALLVKMTFIKNYQLSNVYSQCSVSKSKAAGL